MFGEVRWAGEGDGFGEGMEMGWRREMGNGLEEVINLGREKGFGMEVGC